MMIIYTDNTTCADRFLENEDVVWKRAASPENEGISKLVRRIFETSDLSTSNIDIGRGWNYLLIAKTAPESQYDILIDLGRKNVPLPHGILCLAGEGLKFHGFKGRRWDSPEGNIYLSAHFAPNVMVKNYGAGFMILAAVSVIDAIDSVPGLLNRADIKWVNDILIDDAKVCGVLANTIAESQRVTNAIIGIGLNVEIAPELEPTVFVPRAASLNDFAPDPNSNNRSLLFELLSKSIYKNYLTLIEGGFDTLLGRYRKRLNVIGREVVIYDDSDSGFLIKTAGGRVVSLGDNLELYLEGREKPVKRGRLAFK